MDTGSGLTVPADLTLGRKVFFFDDPKGKILTGVIKSIGEGTCQVQVDRGPEKTVRWEVLVTDATRIHTARTEAAAGFKAPLAAPTLIKK